MKRYSLAGRTPSPTSVANMKGRRYRLCSGSVGTQSRSCWTSSSTALTKASAGSSGIASRRAEAWKRAALASGRKVAIEPSGWR